MTAEETDGSKISPIYLKHILTAQTNLTARFM